MTRYYCQGCFKWFEWMDMHKIDFCKKCWEHGEYLRVSKRHQTGKRRKKKKDMTGEEKLDQEKLERDIAYIKREKEEVK